MSYTETTAGQSKEMPAKMVLFGVPKIGKTTFAAQADDPFFLNVEGGLDYLAKKVRSTPRIKDFDELLGWLTHILNSPDFKCGTLVLDSADWAEELAQKKLIDFYKAKSITDPAVNDFAYYKGTLMAADDAMRILKALDLIYAAKGIKSIIIAHSAVKEVKKPSLDPYQRHEMKLSKYFGARLNEWADLILFADFKFSVSKKEKMASDQTRVLLAGGSASFVGGGRMALSQELPMDYNALVKEITINKGDTK